MYICKVSLPSRLNYQAHHNPQVMDRYTKTPLSWQALVVFQDLSKKKKWVQAGSLKKRGSGKVFDCSTCSSGP